MSTTLWKKLNLDQKSIFEKSHLEGAYFLDLETQLAEIDSNVANGGRHPLPKIETFACLIARLGISTKSHIVVYDDKNGANAAARAWWMFKSIGVKNVQVLNGGLNAAEKIGFPMSSKVTIPKAIEADFNTYWELPLADINEVEKVSKTSNHIVIDVRESARYNGKTEPIDLIAGHIPGAINIPLAENLDENGLFLSPKELQKKYTQILAEIPFKNTIVHCGSGVTACHTILAMAYAGMEIPKLYVGSWSEWSRNNKPIAT